MRVAIVNIGRMVTGDWQNPFAAGDTILMGAGKITSVGTAAAAEVSSADVVIDADGTMAIPGLIDSHVHLTFGDYTPRQRTVGFLESYLHGGVTTAISASEVHVPGRPADPAGVKALAVAASKCFKHYRPAGMRVYGGSIILEPGLTQADLCDVASEGVWLAKAGFGAVKTPFDYAPMIAWAKAASMITTVHTGGSSIPGSSAIRAEHLVAMQPHVSFHVNGGPTALPDEDYRIVLEQTQAALQICTAGNLRTALLCANLAHELGLFDRLILATDTPTGSGVMPLGMLYTIAHCSSLTDLPPEWFLCAATGSNARIYRLQSGFLAAGRDADVVLLDAPSGGATATALEAIKNGDIAAVSAVITDGVPRWVGRSRNTPPGVRKVRVAQCRVPRDFSG
jgi:enamidase